jgi:hypothetical protein
MKQRRRAREMYSDVSDDDEDRRFSVNLTMDDLNDIIKKNVNSAMKSLTSEQSKRRLSRSDSFSTETETFFSGSSSHSTELPNGLLQKQIKAQLDKDKLRGIIKKAVVQEANGVLQKSLNGSAPAQMIPIINEIPPSPQIYHCHYGNQQQHAQHTTPQFPSPAHMPSTHIPPAPPPPPVTGPSAGVSFNVSRSPHFPLSSRDESLGVPQHQMRRNSVAQGSFGNFYDDHFGTMQVPKDEFYNRFAGSNNRLQNRRHTLATLDLPLHDGSSLVGEGMDNFSKALQLLDKTIKQAEQNSTKSKDEGEKEPVKGESSKSDESNKPASTDTIGNNRLS